MYTSDFTPARSGRRWAGAASGHRMPRSGERAPRRSDRRPARRPDLDHTHRLQGHAHLGGRELVVIAPRDDAHSTVVLTTQDWDQVRLAGGEQRRSMLGACAIADRRQLMAVLANHRPMAAAA